jgi:SAM-dependent methyltransferase
MKSLAQWRWQATWRACRTGLRDWRRKREAWRRFWSSYRDYCRLVPETDRPPAHYLYPCLGEDSAETPIEPTYYYQDAWAFGRIVAARPARHVDIGSHHKYVALLSKIVPVTMVDIRPPSLSLDTLEFQQGSITALPFADASLPSVSSMCVIEHIGLGRYGDPLDPAGTEKAARELQRVLVPGGDLYISVPLHNGNRTYFNAHRTFTDAYVRELFAPFSVLDARYIFGNEFTDTLRPGFGTGCYHFRRGAAPPSPHQESSHG